jgi:iron complex transport system ATP-binding protein
MNNAIEIHNLTLGFNEKTLMQSASIGIPRGELVGLIGRNGVGKSTLLRCIAGLDQPKEGVIIVENQPINELNAAQRAQIVSFVATEIIRINGLKVSDVVGFGRSPYTDWFGRMSHQDKQMVRESLEAVKMDSFADKTIDTLSDGERQRVMIARALAQNTPVVLLDEPTAFLDIPNKYKIVSLLQQLSKELNRSILYSTHDLDVAERYCDKLLIIDNGHFSIDTPSAFKQQGTIEKLFHI